MESFKHTIFRMDRLANNPLRLPKERILADLEDKEYAAKTYLNAWMRASR